MAEAEQEGVVLGVREEIMEGVWVPVSKDLEYFSG